MIGESIPPKEMTKVQVADFKGLDVLEYVERNSGIEGELFVTADQASAPVRSQLQAWNLGEGRVEVLEVGLKRRLVPFGASCGDARADTETRP